MFKNILLIVLGGTMIVMGYTMSLSLSHQKRLQDVGADAIMECQIATSSIKTKIDEGKTQEAYDELSEYNQSIKQTASEFMQIKYGSNFK